MSLPFLPFTRPSIDEETIADVAQAMPKFQYDRSRGSFKGWLARVTRNHIADFLTKKSRDAARREEIPEAQMLDAAGALAEDDLGKAWESEWRQHLLDRALRRDGGHVQQGLVGRGDPSRRDARATLDPLVRGIDL